MPARRSRRVLTLEGGVALSAFRRERLLRRLNQAHAAVTNVYAQFMHLVDCEAELDAAQKRQLARLLPGGDHAALPEGVYSEFFVVPRLGTISPWSSNISVVGSL